MGDVPVTTTQTKDKKSRDKKNNDMKSRVSAGYVTAIVMMFLLIVILVAVVVLLRMRSKNSSETINDKDDDKSYVDGSEKPKSAKSESNPDRQKSVSQGPEESTDRRDY